MPLMAKMVANTPGTDHPYVFKKVVSLPHYNKLAVNMNQGSFLQPHTMYTQEMNLFL